MKAPLCAHIALVHLDTATDHYQALHTIGLPENIVRQVILAQKLNRGLEDLVRDWGKVKPEPCKVFLPAYPKSEQKLMRSK